jgi:hypothetical protein
MSPGTVALLLAAWAAEAVPPACTTRDLGNGSLFARGSCEIPVPRLEVWRVLTAYDSLALWVSAMDSSVVVQRDSAAVLVRQVGTTRLLVARQVRMVLRFVEEPPELLRFEIVRGDFPVDYGSWRMDPSPAGTRLVYSLTMRPPPYVPVWIARPFAERILCRTLAQMRRECTRRRGG